MGKIATPEEIAGGRTTERAIERTRARIIFLEAEHRFQEADDERRALGLMEAAQRRKVEQATP